MPLPDQIDEAVNYIKNMKTKVEQMKEKKENLLRTSSSHLKSSSSFDFANNIGIPDQPTTSSRAQTKPMVEIQDMGPSMDVIVVTGLGRVDMFYDIIQLLHQEHGVDVANASFSLHGNSLIQIIHKMGKEITGFEAETLSRKLESLIYGSSSSCCDNYLLEMKQLQFWEFDEQLDTILWGFQPFQFDDNSLELE
ncbi:hypothetical protein Leryth_005039 [Lithospermum erythrorhizon]|nr:hypothetical protein Leryth_005039 [Lithospermum erythrorhizon]